MKYWIAALILLLALLSGSEGDLNWNEVGRLRLSSPIVPRIPQVEASVELASGAHYDLRRRGMVVFTTEQEYLSFTDGQNLWQTPEVDFSSHFLVLVAYGEARTGGHEVEILETSYSDGAVYIKAAFREPAPGSMVTQAIEYPFTLLALGKEKDIRRVVLLTETGEVLCEVLLDQPIQG